MKNTTKLLGFYPTVALGAYVIGIGQLGYTMLLPGLLEIEKAFHITDHQGSYVVSVYVLGMAISTLFTGVLGSLFRECSILIVGLLLFALASFITPLTDSFTVLLFCRFLAGCGTGTLACLVRAIFRSRYQGDELSRALSAYAIFFSVFPLLAPLLGSFIIHRWGWYCICQVSGVIAVFGALLVFAFSNRFAQPLVTTTSATQIWSVWKRCLDSRTFVCYLLIYALGFSIYQLMLVASPYILMRGYSVDFHLYGLLMLFISLGDITGSLVSIAWVKKISPQQCLLRAMVLSAMIFIFMAVVSFMLKSSLPLAVLMVAWFVLMGANSILLANSLSIALSKAPVSTAASSLAGSAQFATASLFVKGVSSIAGLGLFPMSLAGAVISIGVLLVPRQLVSESESQPASK